MSADPQTNIRSCLSVFRSTNHRAKQVCLQCKHRKVGCDGRPSTCGNCDRLGFRCSFSRRDESSGDAGVTSCPPTGEERPQRLRGRKSCTECRVQKVRCSNTRPQCTNCSRRGRLCSYPASKRPLRQTGNLTGETETGPRISPAVDTPGVPDVFASRGSDKSEGRTSLLEGNERGSSRDPSNEDTADLVNKYFEYLYPVPSYAFIHPPTTISRCKHGTLERPLLLAICALTSLRLGLPNMTSDPAGAWVEDAEGIIWQHLERPSMARLQALLLIISYRMETGSFEKAFMLTGIAARAASAMGLNHERTVLDPISEETRRRTMWCFKLLESYFSIGLPEFELCPFECIYLNPPLCEDAFGPQHPPGAEGLSIRSLIDQNERGSLTVCIRLLSIRRDIMKLTRELAVCEEPFLQLTRVTRSLEEELLQLEAEIPNRAEVSHAGLSNLIGSTWLPRYLMMLTLWHGCFCDIYRIFLPGYPEAPPRAVLGAVDPSHIQRAKCICMEHAMATISLLCDVNQVCTNPRLLEFANAVSAYHSTRLVLFIAQSAREPSIPSLEFAVSRAELCLAAIKRFFRASALALPILEDMEQLIKTFSSQTSPMESLTIFHQANRSRDSVLQIPPPAQARQRLAVHSLLRQAEFSDEDTVSTI